MEHANVTPLHFPDAMWARGRATRRGELIVYDWRQRERYVVTNEPGIGMALAAVRSPGEAVAFVTRYGLLGPLRAEVPDAARGDWQVGEPFSNFEQAAEDLRKIQQTVLDVRAAVKGDGPALARLRARFGAYRGPNELMTFTEDHREAFAPPDDQDVLASASDFATEKLNTGMSSAEVHPYVIDIARRSPEAGHRLGGLRLSVRSMTLLGYAYFSLARSLADDPLARCQACQKVFVVEDKRQKYCTPACANRTRFQTWQRKQHEEAQRAAATPKARASRKIPNRRSRA